MIFAINFLFRRSLSTKRKFECFKACPDSPGQIVELIFLSTTNRSECKKCRLDRCFSAGMVPTGLAPLRVRKQWIVSFCARIVRSEVTLCPSDFDVNCLTGFSDHYFLIECIPVNLRIKNSDRERSPPTPTVLSTHPEITLLHRLVANYKWAFGNCFERSFRNLETLLANVSLSSKICLVRAMKCRYLLSNYFLRMNPRYVSSVFDIGFESLKFDCFIAPRSTNA